MSIEDVEQSLLKRALGFNYQETEEILDADGAVTKHKVSNKYVIPDVGALKFWLKNRAPERWRETVKDEGEGPEGFLRFLNLGESTDEVQRAHGETEGVD